jgi:hypothetical protein
MPQACKPQSKNENCIAVTAEPGVIGCARPCGGSARWEIGSVTP